MAVCWSNPNFQTYGLLQKVPSSLLLSPGTIYTSCFNGIEIRVNKRYDGMTCFCSQGTELMSSALSLFQGSWRHLGGVGSDDLLSGDYSPM